MKRKPIRHREGLSVYLVYVVFILSTLVVITQIPNIYGVEIGWLYTYHERDDVIQTSIDVLAKEEFCLVTWYHEDDFPNGWYWNSTESNQTEYSMANYTFYHSRSNMSSSIIDSPHPSKIHYPISIDDLPITELNSEYVFDVACTWTSQDMVMYLNLTLTVNVQKGFGYTHFIPNPVSKKECVVFVNTSIYTNLKSLSIEFIVRGHLGVNRSTYNLDDVSPGDYSFSGKLFYVETDESYPIDKIVLFMQIVTKSGYVYTTTFSGDNYVSISPDFKSTTTDGDDSETSFSFSNITIVLLLALFILVVINHKIILKTNSH